MLLRALHPLRCLHTVHRLPVRHASTGPPPQYSARWSQAIRAESNTNAPDDVPTEPLPEAHELGEGQSDFSNWVDKNEDVSTRQAVIGLGSGLLFLYGVYRYSGKRARESMPVFTERECPTVVMDIPTWKSGDLLRKE